MKKFGTALFGAICGLTMIACTSITPICAGSGNVGERRGEATTVVLFGFLPLGGDNSILKAAKDGGITHIATVDKKVFSLGFYTSVTTVVTGD